MAFLLLIVSLSFAFIFSFFSSTQNSLESLLGLSQNNTFSLIFIGLGILWFSYFFFIVGKNRSKEEKPGIDLLKAKQAMIVFFRDNLYYIGFIFLYISLYLIIGPSIGYDFSYFIFIFSFLILLLFFLTEKFSLFRDLIKINTILFSLYYIISYVAIFVTGKDFFSILDFLNQVFILAFFILNIYNDKTLLKNKVNDNALIGYGFSYLLLFIVFYLSKGGITLWLGFSYIGVMLSIILKNFISNFSFFTGNTTILKILSIFIRVHSSFK